MDEDALNMEVRKFLKQVGVTSQREIEKAVRAAVAGGSVKPGASVRLSATVTAADISLHHEVEGTLTLT